MVFFPIVCPPGTVTFDKANGPTRLPDSQMFRHRVTQELAMQKLVPLMKGSLVLAAGIVIGMTWASGFTEGPVALGQAKSAASAEEQLRKRKIELPGVSKPTNTLVNAVRVGDMLYVSGTGPGQVDGKLLVGRLGQDFDVAKGRAAARQVGLHILAVVKQELGSLDKVQRLVK